MRIFSALRGAVAGLAVAFLQLGIASAATISTPILFLGATNQLVCIANNVSGASLTVTVQIVGIVSSGSVDTCTLAGNDRGGCQVFFNGGGQCRITIAGATVEQVKNRVRGVMFTRSTTPPFALEAVVQAQ